MTTSFGGLEKLREEKLLKMNIGNYGCNKKSEKKLEEKGGQIMETLYFYRRLWTRWSYWRLWRLDGFIDSFMKKIDFQFKIVWDEKYVKVMQHCKSNSIMNACESCGNSMIVATWLTQSKTFIFVTNVMKNRNCMIHVVL